MKSFEYDILEESKSRFDKIYDILVKMESRLEVIEKSVKKENKTKRLLND